MFVCCGDLCFERSEKGERERESNRVENRERERERVERLGRERERERETRERERERERLESCFFFSFSRLGPGPRCSRGSCVDRNIKQILSQTIVTVNFLLSYRVKQISSFFLKKSYLSLLVFTE